MVVRRTTKSDFRARGFTLIELLLALVIAGINETVSAVAFEVYLYNLSSHYLADTWGNPYQWSDPADSLKCHKFWSSLVEVCR